MNRKQVFAMLLMSGIVFNSFAQNVTEGFSKSPHGLLYKIIIDAHKPKANVGDIIKLNLLYSTQNDSVLFSTFDQGIGPVQFNVSDPTFSGDPMEGFAMLGQGDSAVFLMSTDSAYKNQDEMPPFAKKGQYIKISVNVLSLMGKEEYDKKQKEEAAMQTELEVKTIEDYLAKNNLKAQKDPSGIYYIVTKQGEGPRVQSGQTVTVNYTGKLMDGTVFDSSLKPGRHPYDVTIGVSQVIKGWHIGIALLNVGSKGTIIIPSALGYGSRGSGSQIPPNSILIFDIDVLAAK
ncbi:MAG: FKBP-type peptidyl-prolyl cis-trans isomerase [Chitinophagales bacterium]|nr:FKBP-type peptidyl-prolyl cis-trans isomerase [Chitinophagales bacterium]